MSATPRTNGSDPLLRPTRSDLVIAPELGILAVLDATLATAAYQLQSSHLDLSLDAMARGDLPSAQARKASAMVNRFTNLRLAIREYRLLALEPEPFWDDQLHLPF